MASFFRIFRRLARVSVCILPFLAVGALLFGALYAGISLIGDWSPLWPCGDAPELAYMCDSRKSLNNLLAGPSPPLLTIFAAPSRPFSNSPADLQYQALLSWLNLQPTPKIVLLGKDPSFYRVAEEFCEAVSVEPNIDCNLWGTPQVHSMFARAQQERTHFSMIAGADVFLFQDVIETLQNIHSTHEKWVLFGNSQGMDMESFGVTFTIRGNPGLVEMMNKTAGIPITCEEIETFVSQGSRREGHVSYWAWNNLNSKLQLISPLLHSVIPPFSYVEGTFEKWFIRHLNDEAHRVLIDTSDAITSVRIISNSSSALHSMEEVHINGMLLDEGNNDLHPAQGSWKMIRCPEQNLTKLCFVRQSIPPYTTRLSNSNNDLQDLFHHSHNFSSYIIANKSIWRTLDSLLPKVADENKTVVMVGCTSNYKEMLFNFLCRAQSLGVPKVLIAAFDEALYEYAYLQGLPVYLETFSEKDEFSIRSGNGQCDFKSECFKHVSELKSRSVLRVLKKGYHVLWSDTDIIWFENPLPHLLAFPPDTFLIQSDEPKETRPENNILGANSGFYLARSDEKTIGAFEAIVEHAMNSETTEQPSFYTILCGERGERRIGKRECFWEEGGLHTTFLDHKHYPNGHVYKHWRSSNATASCQKRKCVLLHNNYIKGKGNKLRRFVEHDLWFYDVRRRMCIQPWHSLRHPQVPPRIFKAHFLTLLNITET